MINDIQVEYIDINMLKAYEKNAKEHPEKQLQQIAASIKEFGFNSPILISPDGEIIAGHGRAEAARIMGLTEVPVIKLSHLSEAQKRAYRLADNKISANSSWNEDTLRLELSELESLSNDFDVTITGFSNIEIDVLLDDTAKQTKEDEKLNAAPFISESEIVSKPGDIWLLGKHRVICGSALEEETFVRLMQGKLADMILQDPPFNLSNDDIGNLGKTKHASFAMASGEMSDAEFTEFLTTNFKLCAKHSKDGSIHASYMDFRHMQQILAAGEEAFTSFINLCVWNKGTGGMGSLWRISTKAKKSLSS